MKYQLFLTGSESAQAKYMNALRENGYTIMAVEGKWYYYISIKSLYHLFNITKILPCAWVRIWTDPDDGSYGISIGS